MNLFHDFFAFFCLPFMGLHIAGDDAGGGGGGAASPGAGAPDTGGAAQGGSASATVVAAKASGDGPVGGATSVGQTVQGAHLGAFIDDKGSFKPGWTKTYGLPETLEQKFSTPEALLKSHVALERMLGNQNKVAVPNANSTPEERAAFYKAIGRPDKPEAYGIDKAPDKLGEKPFPKELWDADRATGFSKVAHEIGLTAEQAKKLAEFDMKTGMDRFNKFTDANKAAVDAAIGDLKKTWGGNYEANLAMAERAAKEIGLVGPENPELANNPAFIKAMAEVGRRLGEGSAAGARGTSHVQSDPKQQISAIMNDKAHPYWKAQHPEHANAVKQMSELRRLAHPEPV